MLHKVEERNWRCSQVPATLDHARELLQILLKADGSEATMSALRNHLERAGQGELLKGMAHIRPQ